MNQLRTKAIILRRTNYGEADRVLQLLTPDDGRVGAIAKGVRREKSKLAGGLELFAVSDVTIISGKGELGIVSSARLEKFYGNILHDYDRLQLGYEIIKQVAKAVENVPESAFFELLKQSFEYLDDESVDVRLIEIWFRLQISILLGVGLNVVTDINGMKLVEDSQYQFNTSDMAFEHNANGRFTTRHIKLLRLLTIRDPRMISKVSGIDDLVDDCLWLARVVSE